MEWPVLGGKNANWAPESVGAVPRSTSSEGRPGWASPGASAESAMSIAAVLQNLRLDDRAASPATLNRANVADANQVYFHSAQRSYLILITQSLYIHT